VIDIDEMGKKDMVALLVKSGFGHLGCSRNGRPYVLPVHYAYKEPDIFLYTTEGMKTEYITSNPEVCLQVEEVQDVAHWRSVIVTGKAERLKTDLEKQHAMKLISERNPELSPAISRTWTDAWGRANIEAIFRITPEEMSGRQTR